MIDDSDSWQNSYNAEELNCRSACDTVANVSTTARVLTSAIHYSNFTQLNVALSCSVYHLRLYHVVLT